ncbi:MAG TPA: flagellar biosynthetic protein FliR [Stenotrophomonas sp.]|nr:flagellar biosynthetic protein FliR [Stenotrophomonas sp.]
MNVDPLLAFALLFGLAGLRYLPVTVLPGLSPLGWAPLLVRIATMLSLAWLTVVALPDGYAAPTVESPWLLLSAAVGELVLGTVFGLGFLVPNAAVHMSGWMMDMQAGLGAASLFNPASADTQESLLGQALVLSATVLFFTLDLHLLLYRLLAASVVALPLGAARYGLDTDAFMFLLGGSFITGLAMILPVLLGLLAVDLAVGYASRSMPQANIYFLALPLKIGVALGLLALSLQYAPMLLGRLFRDGLQQAPLILRAP